MYFKHALRARAAPTLRIQSTRLVTSITTLVVMSIFPTVYMHIRSPAIDTVADSIFYVSTNGGAYISDYISTYSYGRRSPCFEHDRDNAGCFIFLTGHVFGNWEVTVIDSYGNSPDISDVRFVWMIFPSGFINHNLDYTISYFLRLSGHGTNSCQFNLGNFIWKYRQFWRIELFLRLWNRFALRALEDLMLIMFGMLIHLVIFHFSRIVELPTASLSEHEQL